MTRLCIVCASCRNNWPLQGASSPYLEMQLMSQPCPRCEAYTLSFLLICDAIVACKDRFPDEDEAVLPVIETADS